MNLSKLLLCCLVLLAPSVHAESGTNQTERLELANQMVDALGDPLLDRLNILGWERMFKARLRRDLFPRIGTVDLISGTEFHDFPAYGETRLRRVISSVCHRTLRRYDYTGSYRSCEFFANQAYTLVFGNFDRVRVRILRNITGSSYSRPYIDECVVLGQPFSQTLSMDSAFGEAFEVELMFSPIASRRYAGGGDLVASLAVEQDARTWSLHHYAGVRPVVFRTTFESVYERFEVLFDRCESSD